MADFMDKIFQELRRLRGLDLRDYHQDILREHLKGRISELQLKDPLEYLEHIRSDASECDNLIDAVTIHVSSFFRNPIMFETIAQDILPRIIERKRNRYSTEIRVWCAGCATGEEAYSIAILIREALDNKEVDWTPYIFATDISQNALNTAESGTYTREHLKNSKLGIFDRYFVDKGDVYEVTARIREMVMFSYDDLTSTDRFAPAESIFGTFDLILCRNVLIYFNIDLQRKVFDKLYKSLARGGHLILGDCESLNQELSHRLMTIDRENRIFQKPE